VQTWGIKGKDLYLLLVLRKRTDYPDLEAPAFARMRSFRGDVVLIETSTAGTQLSRN